MYNKTDNVAYLLNHHTHVKPHFHMTTQEDSGKTCEVSWLRYAYTASLPQKGASFLYYIAQIDSVLILQSKHI